MQTRKPIETRQLEILTDCGAEQLRQKIYNAESKAEYQEIAQQYDELRQHLLLSGLMDVKTLAQIERNADRALEANFIDRVPLYLIAIAASTCMSLLNTTGFSYLTKLTLMIFGTDFIINQLKESYRENIPSYNGYKGSFFELSKTIKEFNVENRSSAPSLRL